MFINLPHYSIFKVHGAQAKTFLQGQLTGDIEKLNATDMCLTAYCDPKGRLWSIMRGFKHGTDYYFHLPTEVMNATIGDLAKYAVFSKVAVEPATQSSSLALLGNEDNKLPEDVLKLKVDKDRWLLIGPTDSLNNIKTDSNSPDAWNIAEIRAGIPTIWENTMGKLLPHDVNLIELDAVCFTKGCYKGQEIIARMQYRGQRKKKMYHAVCQMNSCPLPGSAITDASGKNVGEIVSAAMGEKGCEILVILPIALVDEKVDIFCDGNIFRIL